MKKILPSTLWRSAQRRIAKLKYGKQLNNYSRNSRTPAEIPGLLPKGRHILDMPHEILMEILGFASTQGIQSCRLTCRSFHDLSSELLIRVVRVDHRASSLSRLGEICSHPTLSKGVRTIRVALHAYHWWLALSLDQFILHHAEALENRVRFFEPNKACEEADVSEAAGMEAARSARALLASWRRMLEGNMTSEDELHRARLEQTHKKYERLYLEQEWIMKNGRFAQAVGSAVTKMPFLRHLEFTDARKENPYTIPCIDTCEKIYQGMLEPMTGYDVAWATRSGTCLSGVIPEAIGAIGGARVCLDSIQIRLAVLRCALVPKPESGDNIAYATQQLKRFSFESTDYMSEGQTIDISGFLQLCLNSPSLTSLRLDLGPADGFLSGSIGEALTTRLWPELTDVFLGRVSIELSDLLRFIRALPSSSLHLEMMWIRLLSGTWQEVLSALREKSCRVPIISGPKGTWREDVSGEEISRIVGILGDEESRTSASFPRSTDDERNLFGYKD
ncbi:hypothetical protein QBC34DRAFT_437379 [Podospora aff. communis PSN243]|uniref:F-box domain-containing protein n=1 Tax=Podospora aff. communis PSN243 TaxID=3040156 RepID=A0AAV9GPQ0_9PEZI|nr:hypothetical protein QBC34DRAFT_437379 [Podospora aff. communis PSN243]